MKRMFRKRTQRFVTQLLCLSALLVFSVYSANANNTYQGDSDSLLIQGRWDLTLTINGKEYPSWLEISHSGHHMLVGQFVGIVGSARPIARVNFVGGKMSFAIPPQWDKGTADLQVEGTLQGDHWNGTMISCEGETYSWTGVRAPSLRRDKPAVWGAPIRLFNGKDLSGWHAMGDNQWIVAPGGILKSPKSGANLITDKTFTDFKLHIEFRYPKESNSGVYLRGRHEVQVTDSKGLEPSKDQLGAIYGFITPSEMPAKDAGEWQSYDITLTGRMVTVVCNGKTIICNREIPGITGGAINSNEGEPGPLLIQGDHGPIEYRNIVITPAK
ncbi:MAG: DUF1080 domain-containing protein [Agriterribacter sp.]